VGLAFEAIDADGQRLGRFAPAARRRRRPISDWRLLESDVLRWLRQSPPDCIIVIELLELRLGFEPESAALAARGAGREDSFNPALLEASSQAVGVVAVVRGAQPQTATPPPS
jgi:hypothetical protein